MFNIEVMISSTASLQALRVCIPSISNGVPFKIKHLGKIMESPKENDDSQKVRKLCCPYNECTATFPKKRSLINHLRTHTGERPFTCDRDGCSKTYTNSSHLLRHKKSHAAASVTNVACSKCSKVFSNEQNLKRHVRRFHNPDRRYGYRCTECDEGFHRRSLLHQHTYEHTGVFYYKCDVCDERFRTKHHLNRHGRTHTSYDCEACGGRFERWSALLAHRREEHKSVIPCDVCGKIFGQPNSLKAHMTVHQDEKTEYVCTYDDCDRTYSYKKNLQYHVKAFHLNIKKKVPCPIANCDMMLSSQRNLKNHLKVHEKGLTKKAVGVPHLHTSTYRTSTAVSLSGLQLPPLVHKEIIDRSSKLTAADITPAVHSSIMESGAITDCSGQKTDETVRPEIEDCKATRSLDGSRSGTEKNQNVNVTIENNSCTISNLQSLPGSTQRPLKSC